MEGQPLGELGGPQRVPAGVDLDPTTIPVPADTFAALFPVLAGLAVAAFLVTMASVVVRHRRSRGIERDQMRGLLRRTRSR